MERLWGSGLVLYGEAKEELRDDVFSDDKIRDMSPVVEMMILGCSKKRFKIDAGLETHRLYHCLQFLIMNYTSIA